MVRVRHIALGLLVSVAATARGDPPVWLAQFDGTAGLYPEQVGWTRYTDHGGAQRWFEDGRLVLDGRASGGIVDFYDTFRPGMAHVNLETALLFEWRLRVDCCNVGYDLDVGVCSDNRCYVAFTMGYNFIQSVFEHGVSAPFSPGVYHDFQCVWTDAYTYVLYIDGRRAFQGSPWPYAVDQSRLGWGDSCYGPITMSHWAYARFGVVAAVRPGDLNCDGDVDFDDINPFVFALTDPHAYQDAHPGCPVANGDVNSDGRVDFDDINPFVVILLGR